MIPCGFPTKDWLNISIVAVFVCVCVLFVVIEAKPNTTIFKCISLCLLNIDKMVLWEEFYVIRWLL